LPSESSPADAGSHVEVAAPRDHVVPPLLQRHAAKQSFVVLLLRQQVSPCSPRNNTR
jgi:hypothetical protein